MELPTLKIVLIEDNFIQRTLIRDFLKKIEKTKCNLEVYTSSNGVEGLGYVFITKPDILIIDSTLPEYSGIELVEYLNKNLKKLQKITFLSIIVLTETEKDLGLAPDFIVFNKNNKNFLKNLSQLLEINLSQVDLKTNSEKKFCITKPESNSYKELLFSISNKTLKWANYGDILISKIRQSKNILAKFFYGIFWIFAQITTNQFLLLFKLLKGYQHDSDENFIQHKADVKKFRVRIYPTLATVLITFGLIIFQISVLLAGGIAFLGNKNRVQAATITWDGEGNDALCGGSIGDGDKWSCAENWSTDVVPTSSDTVLFDSTSLKNSVIDSSFTNTILDLTITSAYSGSISLQTSLNIANNFTQNGGAITSSANNFEVLGSFTMNGGTFNAPSLTLAIGGNFSFTGGTFNSNLGTISFINNSATISCGTAIFNNVTVNAASSATKTINSNCNLPIGNNPTINGQLQLQGILSGTGILTTNHQIHLMGNGNFSGFNSYVSNGSFNITITTNTLDFSTYSSLDFNSAFTLNSGTFISTPNNMSVANNLTILAVDTTFNANNGTLIFDGGNANLFCNGAVFNTVQINANPSAIKTISNTCNLNLGNNPTINGDVHLSGELQGTGTLKTYGSFIFKHANADLVGFNGFILDNTGPNPNLEFSIDTTANTNLNFGSYTLVDINGFFLIYSGSFTAPSGTMTISRHIYTEANTFIHNNGTVIFDGINQIISGQATYYNFTKTTNFPDTLYFPSAFTKTIEGTLTLQGDSGAALNLRSFTPGNQWSINPQGARNIGYLDVQDSNNINSTLITTSGFNIINSGNNTGWNFNDNPLPPTFLGEPNFVNGSFTNTNPELSFTLSDPNPTDTVKYRIQLDDNSDYSSPVIDYSSGLDAQGVFNFTVGQDAGLGTYSIGNIGQTLTDGEYYWRVKTIDINTDESTYTNANSGSIAFKIDNSPPTTPSQPVSINPTNDPTPAWNWNTSEDTGSGLNSNPYVIEWSNTSDFNNILGTAVSNSNSYTHSIGLSEGQLYFRVKAKDVLNNESSFSATGNTLVDLTPPTGSISINSGAAETTSTSVNLNISATDSLSGINQMIISSDENFTSAIYENFSATKQYLLNGGNGIKNIYIKFRDNAGNESAVYSDSISLNISNITPTPSSTPTSTIQPFPSVSPIQTLIPTPTTQPTLVIISPTNLPAPTSTVFPSTQTTPTSTILPFLTQTPSAMLSPTSVNPTLTPSTTVTPNLTTKTSPTPVININTTKTPPTQDSSNIVTEIQSKVEEISPEFLKPIVKEAGTFGLVSAIALLSTVNLETLLFFLRSLLLGGFFLPFFRNIFAEKPGKVIDSKTKEGIPFVGIKVLNSETRKVIKKTMTNLNGNYRLELLKGTYEIEFISKNYILKSIEVNLTEDTVLERITQLEKDFSKDIATQIQFKTLKVDPKEIILGFALLFAFINGLFIRTITSIAILIFIAIVFTIASLLKERRKSIL